MTSKRYEMAERFSGLKRYINMTSIGIDPGQQVRENLIEKQGRNDGFNAGYDAGEKIGRDAAIEEVVKLDCFQCLLDEYTRELVFKNIRALKGEEK